jgi:hypothetical protein
MYLLLHIIDEKEELSTASVSVLMKYRRFLQD